MEPCRVLAYRNNSDEPEVYNAMLSKNNINTDSYVIYIVRKFPQQPYIDVDMDVNYAHFLEYWTDVAYSITTENNSEIVGRYIPDKDFNTNRYMLWRADGSDSAWIKDNLRTLRLALDAAMQDYCYNHNLSINRVL